jgi:hypothetical protein
MCACVRVRVGECVRASVCERVCLRYLGEVVHGRGVLFEEIFICNELAPGLRCQLRGGGGLKHGNKIPKNIRTI